MSRTSRVLVALLAAAALALTGGALGAGAGVVSAKPVACC